MRALSIRQPYAEQILRGTKRFEYRSRPTTIRERVYIYASLKPGPAKEFEQMRIHPAESGDGRACRHRRNHRLQRCARKLQVAFSATKAIAASAASD